MLSLTMIWLLYSMAEEVLRLKYIYFFGILRAVWNNLDNEKTM